jgi:hypothetical protein
VETECSSKTLVDFHQTTQHYIPEDRTLQINIIIPYNIDLLRPVAGTTKQIPSIISEVFSKLHAWG